MRFQTLEEVPNPVGFPTSLYAGEAGRMSKPQLFQCFRFSDAERAMDFLQVLGFTEIFVVRDEDDPTLVVHAQYRWRDNGGIMFGSDRNDGMPEAFDPGGGVCNIVVESDETVDELFARAVAAGATAFSEPSNPPHGGRTAGVLDFDGNYWNIDSYPGE